MKADEYDAKQRALEKQRSRDADEQALASGDKSQAQLREENGAFAFPPERVRLDVPRVKLKL